MSLYSKIYLFIFPFFRKKRMNEFTETFFPTQETRILDVGGTTYNWQLINSHSKITILNLTIPPEIDTRSRIFSFVKGNGLSLQFPDGSYDICYSNSTIEHVGTFENQMRFRTKYYAWENKFGFKRLPTLFSLSPICSHLSSTFYQKKASGNYSVTLLFGGGWYAQIKKAWMIFYLKFDL